jgi:nicotinamidase-related amidase
VPLVRREDSVFVVVDAQPGFFADDALSEDDAQRAADAVTRITWMAGLATLLEIPAVVVEEGPGRNGHTDQGILERLPSGTPTIEKQTFGLTACEEAVAAIHATGRTTAVLVGFETDVCVAQSAVGLVDRGFRAVVPEDATYTNSAVEHERGVARMAGAGVERNHCKGLTFEWLHTVDQAIETFPEAAALGTPPWRLPKRTSTAAG